MPRVLIIDKTAGLLASHERHQAMAQVPDIELHVFGPRHWVENGRSIEWKPKNPNYNVHFGSVAFKDYYARHFYYSGLCRSIIASQPDIIQLFEEPWAIASLQSMLAASVFSPSAKILFYTWENIYRSWVYPSRLSKLYAIIDRLMHQRSHAAVCATESARNVLRQKGYTKPLCVIPYGLPSPFFQKEKVKKTKSSPFTVGYIGRMRHMKGVDTLLKAVSNIPDCHVKLIGDGEDKAQFQKLAKALDIDNRVEWLASLPEDQISSVMRDLDVFVLPSRTTPGWKEQLGRVAIEAMAMGIPVIGSDSGAIPEVIDNAGLMFPEGDAEQLSACILQLRGNSALREELSRKGETRAREHFTWTRFTNDINEFYQSL